MKKIFLLSLAFILSAAASFADDGGTKRSFKRGFGENSLNYVEDLEVLAQGCSWYYNWGVAPSGNVSSYIGADKTIEFVPMAWNGGYDINALRSYYTAHPQDKYLLGFNEPNFRAQANMTPTQAAEKWPALEQLADEFGLKLVAPALNYPDSAINDGKTYQPTEWMDAFIAAYKSLYGKEPRMDYVALHCYMDQPAAQKGFIEDFAKRYNKQVWLTEFCAWESKSITAAQQQEYMIEKVRDLEKSEYVARYAWFKARNSNLYPYYNLVEYPNSSTGISAGTLTDLGFAYIHMSTFDADKYYPIGETVPVNEFIDESGLKNIRRSIDPRTVGKAELYLEGNNISTSYQFDVPEAGDYKLILRASRAEAGTNPRVNILDAKGTEIASAFTIQPTGGDEKTYAANVISLTLQAGKQTITVQKDNFAPIALSLIKLVKETSADDPDMETLVGEEAVNPGGGGDDGGDDGDTGDNTSSNENVKITDAATNPFTFSADDKFYAIFLDETTRQANAIDDSRFVNLGDNGGSQNSYVWENTFTDGDVTGNNSFGVTGNYRSLVVSDKNWSGFGYNVNSEAGDLDLSCINKDYSLHLALKSSSKQPVDIYFTDGKGRTAHLVFGDKDMNGIEPVGNFKRDGKWHNVDIPMSYIESRFGLSFRNDTDYDGNLMCINAGAKAGTDIAFDAVFFHGPKDSQPDAEEPANGQITVTKVDNPSANPFTFKKSDRYYVIYLDAETKGANLTENQIRDCGPNDATRNVYPWENTLTGGDAVGDNSFGVPGGYSSWTVGNVGWNGLGYSVVPAADATNQWDLDPLDLTGITTEYTLHFAVKSTSQDLFEFVLNDGTRDAQIVLGQGAFDGHEAVADFERDGKWHNIEVPIQYLNSKFGTNFKRASNYSGNFFVVRSSGGEGHTIDYDAVFIYGPGDTPEMEKETLDNRELTITKASEAPFTISADNFYYAVSLDAETMNSISKDNLVYIGPDEQTRFLYPWEGTLTAADAAGDNSLGVTGGYNAWTVGSAGWSGLGYSISEDGPVDLSGINAKYTFHFAVKSTATEPFDFILTDQAGHQAHIVLGQESYDDNAPVGDFSRDGEWYNVDVPASWLVRHGLDFRTSDSYSDNIVSVLAGKQAGTTLAYDAICFYGPKPETTGIEAPVTDGGSMQNGMQGVEVYSISGMKIGKAGSLSELNLQKGIYIVRSSQGVRKVMVK